ncbi:MAG: anaerobic ribonucleoside triphosphate reductase, partial [Paraclostridium sp.]
FIHNLNTMHSRAGAQVPFSSVNFGTDTSPEGRLIIKNLLLSVEKGLGNGETAIFPILIFKVKEGINLNPEDPNYDLFKLACRVSAKRLFPNFSFLDAPFNAKYYVEGRPETEATYMGCRTRVVGNVCGEEIVSGRGNLSFTTINLPRLGIKHGSLNGQAMDVQGFYNELDEKIDLVIEQLLERFEVQASKKVKNFPFLMGQNVWKGSDELGPNDTLREVIKQGTLTVGFIGLAECLIALIGKHHGESEEAQKLGLEIITHMRERMEEASDKYRLNFSLIATPAEGLAGRFTAIDKKQYGEIKGITDKEYYTNSFHVPVYHKLSSFDKIRIEAPYHELTNAGHITYIELDGSPSNNLEAFETIIRAMKELGIGYGSINHPLDRDPVCGYSGVIPGDVCPACGRKESDGEIGFERIRRITGYLVGTVDRFNNAKKAEVRDRVKHN